MQHIHTSYARDAAHAHTHFSYCEFFHRMCTPADPPHYGENGLNRRSEPLENRATAIAARKDPEAGNPIVL